MRPAATLIGLTLLSVLCLAAWQQPDTCAVTLTLVDSDNGRVRPGLIHFETADGAVFHPPELLSRGLGLEKGATADQPIHRWSVLPGKTVVNLPRLPLTIEAISGIDTEAAKLNLDLSGKTGAELAIPLVKFYNASSAGFRSGNTHLHLMKISREQADRYLGEVPKADGLDALFVSYLERVPDDRDYISNAYRSADLARLAARAGTVFGNGEEHRHNLEGYGEGYGHVMFLNIDELIQPVSIGPGIMKMGTDGIPLRRGIDTARSQGATVVWCHNDFGLEDLPNLAAGRLDAQNIFDGSVKSSYKETFYRYLNAGFRVPFSTGTDWFMYDFSRAYVDMGGDVTVEKWLAGLAAGKSFITNGPFLQLRVAGSTPGKALDLDKPADVAVEAQAAGRVDFGRIELVRNGEVISAADTKPVGGHFEASLRMDLPIGGPCWFALRTPPPPVAGDAAPVKSFPTNELGGYLFAHTSAVHVTFAGKNYFDPQAAQGLLAEIHASRDTVTANAKFADDQERARVLDVYADGIAALEQHIQKQESQGLKAGR